MDTVDAPREGYEDYYLRLNPPDPANYRRKARGYDKHFGPLLQAAGAKTCLDLGCGTGLFAYYLRSRGCDVVGVDVNEPLVAAARQHVQAEFVVDDAMHYLLTCNRRFDMISLLDLLEHIPREKVIDLLRAVRAALTDTGFAIVRTPNMNAPAALGMFYSDWTHCSAFTEGTLVHVARVAGFSRVEHVDQFRPMSLGARLRARFSAFLARRVARLRGGHIPRIFHRNLLTQMFR